MTTKVKHIVTVSFTKTAEPKIIVADLEELIKHLKNGWKLGDKATPLSLESASSDVDEDLDEDEDYDEVELLKGDNVLFSAGEKEYSGVVKTIYADKGYAIVETKKFDRKLKKNKVFKVKFDDLVKIAPKEKAVKEEKPSKESVKKKAKINAKLSDKKASRLCAQDGTDTKEWDRDDAVEVSYKGKKFKGRMRRLKVLLNDGKTKIWIADCATIKKFSAKEVQNSKTAKSKKEVKSTTATKAKAKKKKTSPKKVAAKEKKKSNIKKKKFNATMKKKTASAKKAKSKKKSAKKK